MPERLDSVIIATSRHHVVIPWASRDVLVDWLQEIRYADDIVAAFEAVGASRPVALTEKQEATLHEAIEQWEHEVGTHNLPTSIDLLRDTLGNVLVSYSRGVVEIPGDSRDELLARLEMDPATADIVTAFGASNPVQLTDDQMAVINKVVDPWLEDVGITRLPSGIFRLRKAIKDHLHDIHLHG